MRSRASHTEPLKMKEGWRRCGGEDVLRGRTEVSYCGYGPEGGEIQSSLGSKGLCGGGMGAAEKVMGGEVWPRIDASAGRKRGHYTIVSQDV